MVIIGRYDHCFDTGGNSTVSLYHSYELLNVMAKHCEDRFPGGLFEFGRSELVHVLPAMIKLMFDQCAESGIVGHTRKFCLNRD